MSGPLVTRVQGDELIELIDELMAAHQGTGWVRLMTQDGGVKVAHGQGVWSLPFGEDITPHPERDGNCTFCGLPRSVCRAGDPPDDTADRISAHINASREV